jgi:hypothetical protein
MGRNQLEANQQRLTVKDLAAHGFPEEEIAVFARVGSLKKLRRSFGDEVEFGPIGANLEVAKNLFEMATEHNSATAATFWLRCRARWSAKAGSGAGEEEEEVRIIYPEPTHL